MPSLFDRFLDTRPLRRQGPFRRLWIGTSLQSFGRQVAVIAVLFQAWELTHSSFWVGVVGAIQAVAIIVFGLLGGVLADSMDRRKLSLLATTGAFGISVLLALQAALGANSFRLLLILLCVQAAFFALGSPARRTFVPTLLPKDQVAAGIALTLLSFQASLLLGPALAGFMIAAWGLTICYVIEAVAFCAAFYGVTGLPELRPEGAKAAMGLKAIRDGLSFIRQRPVLSGAFLGDLAAAFLAMPIALFPAINAARFAGDPKTLGLFLSMIAIGGIIAGAFSGWFTRIRHTGQVQLGAATVWGLALLGAGLTGNLPITLACLAVAGAADMIAVISRGTVLQLATPDSYRGRISSVEQIVGVAGPELGNFRAGLLASFTSPAIALAAGGASCIAAIALIAATYPALRRFDARATIDASGNVRNS